MQTKYKFRRLKPDRGPHHQRPASNTVGTVTAAADTAGVDDSARDAALVMIKHHERELARWRSKLADLEGQLNQ